MDGLGLRGRVELDRHVDEPEGDRPVPDRARHAVPATRARAGACRRCGVAAGRPEVTCTAAGAPKSRAHERRREPPPRHRAAAGGRGVLIGVDWGGTKIEVIAMPRPGPVGSRGPTPWSDYDGCLGPSPRWWRGRGGGWPAGHGRVGLPARSTRGRPDCQGREFDVAERPAVEDDLRASWAATSAPRTTPTASPSPRPPTARARPPRRLRSDPRDGAPAPASRSTAAPTTGPTTARGVGPQPAPLPDVTEIPGRLLLREHGCLERWVSGRAFAQDYRRHAQVDLASRSPAPEVIAAPYGPGTGSPGWSGPATSTDWPAACPSWSTPSTRTCWSSAVACPTSPSSTLSSRRAGRISSPRVPHPDPAAAHGDSSGVRGAAGSGADDALTTRSASPRRRPHRRRPARWRCEYFGRVGSSR